ncbi:MAG: tetratricopeptide repeat protein [Bacteroidetes bacterium]|nr:tetratricopeptide repeat protein [Bacteroidota bacterium]
MSKTIQYKNPNLNKKTGDKEIVTNKNLSYSMVVVIQEQHNQLFHFIECLKKIKQDYYSKFEFILVDNQASAAIIQKLETEEIFKTLTAQNLVKVVKTKSLLKKVKAFQAGIENATKDVVLVFDIDKLSNSFNINDLFSFKKDITGKVGVAVFQQKEKTKRNSLDYSLLLGERNLLDYLFTNVNFAGNDYKYEINYQLKQAEIETEEIPVFQANPFTETPHPFYLTKVYKNILNRINWFFIIPVKELKGKPKNDLLPKRLKESSVFRLLFAAFAIITFIAMPLMAYHAGNSADEDYYQYPQALRVYNYYASFGKDTSFTNADNKDMEGMKDYGMSFDLLTVVVNKMLHVDKIFESRHAMNAMVGWLAMLFCGLLAYRLANWRAALITFFLMFFSPRFLGHSFNNPKDVPFAMAYIFCIYYIVRFFQQFPKPSKKVSFYVALGIAMAISVRIGGLLLIAYLFVFMGFYALFTTNLKSLFAQESIAKFKKLLIYAAIISVAGYFMGILLWPYALQSPISNPQKTLAFMSNFTASLRQIYEGVSIWSDKVPWYYTIKYILISVPVSVIVGAILFIFLEKKKDLQYFWVFVILFSFGFPIFYIAYKHSNVYGGWRHAMFTYPPLVVAAGLGFNSLINVFKNNYLKIGAAVALVLLTTSAIRHTIKNHPYEYVYYNEFVGGVKGAFGNYEMDYYVHSLKQAAEWVKENAEKDSHITGRKIKVGAWITSPLTYYFRKDTAKFEVVFIRYYEKGNTDWDYALFVNMGINPAPLKNHSWPPANAVHTITVDGKPICVVLKRTDKSDLLGYQAMGKNDTTNAVRYFNKALEVVPTNETVLLNLADLYTRMQKLDSADITIKRLLKFDPELDNALYSQAIIYYTRNDVENALLTANRIIKNNVKYYMAYYIAAYAYLQKKDANSAIISLNKLLEQNQGFKPAYILLSQIYQQQGDMENAQKYASIANQLR